MEAQFKEVLSEAAVRTFRTMLMVELEPVTDGTGNWDCTGVVRLTGGIACEIGLVLTGPGARGAVARFTGEPAEDKDDISDCVGELVNMIAGNAKNGLSHQYALTLSLPEVWHGRGFVADRGYEVGSTLLFKSELGPVQVAFACKKAK